MKGIVRYIFYCIVLLLVGCVDSIVTEEYRPTSEAHYLKVSSSELNYGAKGGSKELFITSSQNWNFSDYASWLNLSTNRGSGNSNLTITAEENMSADIVRTSVFYLNTMDEGWSYTKCMSADQEAAIPYILFSPKSLTVSGSSSSHKVNVSANTQWTVRCDADWLEIIPASDLSSFDVIVSENLTNQSRSANVILVGAKTEIFVVTQNAANFTSDTKTLEYVQSGGSYLLKINSEVSWEVNTSYDWIDVTPTCGVVGDTDITISTTPNWSSDSRIGFVSFYIGKDKYTSIIVKQDGVKLSTIESELSFRALGDSKIVEVDANISWKVLSKPSWVSVTPESADGSAEIVVSVENNSEASNRTGVIKLGNDGITQTAEITISQDGKYFSVNNESLLIGSTGGKMQVALATNDSWSVNLVNNVKWLSVLNNKGEENQVIDFIAGDNPSVNTRSETARISPKDLDPVDVVIRQKARFLTVNSDGVQFFSKGGISAPIIISTDGKYTVSEQIDWFSISHEGDVLTIMADANETGHIRTGDITITLTDLVDGSMTLTLTVTQVAPGGNFSREDYAEDNLWDVTYNSVFTISVVGYSVDDNWDEKEYHGLTLTVEGYKEDENWDGTSGSGTIGKDDYGSDDSYNTDGGSGSIGKEDYISDDNYDNDNVE